jgi:molybdate transport system substrate-binding protein
MTEAADHPASMSGSSSGQRRPGSGHGIASGVTAEFDRKNTIRSGRSPLQAVARGDAELGFTQISEIIAAPEVELVGPLPAEIQNYTIFVAGIPTDAGQAIVAKAFLEFAGSPTASAVLRSKGLE